VIIDTVSKIQPWRLAPRDTSICLRRLRHCICWNYFHFFPAQRWYNELLLMAAVLLRFWFDTL